MICLRQSTASQEVPLGYFVDSTDGNTEETALTIANTDIKLWKTGATTLASKNSGGATHISNGIYYAVLDATDTDTIGPMVVFVHVAGALTVRLECCVLDEAVYDALFGTVALATATNITAAAGITLADNAVAAAKIATDAFTAAKFAASSLNGKGDWNVGKTGYSLSAAGVQAIWDALTSALTTVGSIGKLIVDNLNAAVGTVSTNVSTLLTRLGTPSDLGSGAHVAGNLIDIEGQTDDIGAAGAGLTAIPDSAGVTSLLSRIPAALFSGITSMAHWLGALAGKQAPNATAQTEIRATGAGSGTFDPTTDSLEALRDTAPMGSAMRGTDNAALASVCTEARLAELDAANLPADAGTLLTRLSAARAGYLDNLSAGAVALASIATEARLSELDAGTAGKAAAEIDLIKTAATAIQAITDAIGATAAANLAKSCSAAGIPGGAAEAGTLTTAAMTTDLAEATDDHYNGRVVIWLTGVLAGQSARISDYAGATGLITFESAITEAPGAGDTFIIL